MSNPTTGPGSSTAHIYQSLFVNLAVTAAKGAAAALTGSGAMLAETIHTAADCGNQLLLLLGVIRARKAPDAEHPLGYGRALYFWSFMVALLLFTGGGVFSVYEGIHKIIVPEPIQRVWLGIGILLLSLVLEGYALFCNVVEMNRRRGSRPFVGYVLDSKDSDLVVVFGENGAAVAGLACAIASLGLAWATGDGRWDALGSLGVGLLLVGVAIFLAIEVKSLILGERADPEIEEAVRLEATADPRIASVSNLITIQQGPGEVVVALKISCPPDLTARDLSELINRFEARLRSRRPEVRWCFVEPDLRLP